MLTMKTAELIGISLDWAVAKCEGAYLAGYEVDWRNNRVKKYSIDWAQGGPIIEREMREFGFDLWAGAHVPDGQFAATYCRGASDSYMYGSTPLIAAMRCYVDAKLGDEIEIPEELKHAKQSKNQVF